MRPTFLFDLQSIFTEQIRQQEEESSKVFEPMIGIVTDNKDPQKLGRVKVKLSVLQEQQTTFWAPLVMLGAGKNRGWFFIPEVDDEVLVLFEHGAMDRPLVVGALWGGKDKPPEKNPGSNPKRVIKSRQGSKITFDDEKNQLLIEDGTGAGKILFEADSNKITIEAIKGDVCFQSPTGDMQILAKEMELTAKEKLEVHAGGAMAWGTDSKADLKGGSSMTISGSKGSVNCGSAQMPTAPESTPEDVADPYGS